MSLFYDFAQIRKFTEQLFCTSKISNLNFVIDDLIKIFSIKKIIKTEKLNFNFF